jgi:hypothetical protein
MQFGASGARSRPAVVTSFAVPTAFTILTRQDKCHISRTPFTYPDVSG